MTKINHVFIHILCTLFLLSSSTGIYANTTRLCEPQGYTLGFFNGILNTESDATYAMDTLRDDFYGTKYRNQEIKYEVFYNHTEGAVLDIIEVFIQRGHATHQELAERFELFWEVLDGSGSSPGSFTQNLLAGITNQVLKESISAMFGGLIDEARTLIVGGMAVGLTDQLPQFLHQDYDSHRTRLDTLLAEGEKLVLVAHSQGNLFVNATYDYAMTKVEPENVKVVHIAPAAASVRGDYVLANMDLVIKALALTSGSVPASNVDIPLGLFTDDLTGHLFIDTYLSSRLATKPLFKQHLQKALDEIIPAGDGENRGIFSVTVTWDGPGDIDLHVLEPNFVHVDYYNKEGVSGFLDMDNQKGWGPEHYFASCDQNRLVKGKYIIGMSNYRGANERKAIMQLSTAQEGAILTLRSTAGPESHSGSWNYVIPFIYLEIVEDDYGNYQVDVDWSKVNGHVL